MELSSKYEDLWKDNKSRYFIITGGRGSAKSFSVSTFLTDLAIREAGQTILFTRYTLTSAHISIIPEFEEKIELLNLLNKYTINKTEIDAKNGSKILFRGIKTSSGNQTANLKSIQGVTTWVLDEAEELTDEATFDKIDDSIRTVGFQNRIILVLNPCTQHHWIYKRFFEKGKQPNTCYIHTSYLDNAENLSQSFIDKAERVKSINKTLYEHRYLGAWLDRAEGTVFDNWVIGDFDMSLQVIYGQDYGFSNDPSTLIKVAIDDKHKKLYVDECFVLPKLSTQQIFELNSKYAGGSLIIGDSAEPRLIDELSKKGLNIKGAEKGQGSISAGILAMQDYTIVVTANSTNIQKELRNYVWLDTGAKLVIDDFNHCFIGSTLITTNKGTKQIKDIAIGEEVFTSQGYNKVIKTWENGTKQVNKYIIDVVGYDKKLYLCCTSNHKIKINGLWQQVKTLQQKDVIYQHKSLMVKNITSTRTKSITQKVQKDFMLLFGNTTMGKCQKDFMYITLMGILQIMIYIIYLLSRLVNTLGCTLRSITKRIKNLLGLIWRSKDHSQKYGIKVLKVENGIKSKQKRLILVISHMVNLYVWFVVKHLLRTKRIKSIVAITANLNIEEITDWITLEGNVSFAELFLKLINTKKIDFALASVVKNISIEKMQDENVYDITVANCHEYFANGILVHNCIDAIRYAHFFMTKTKRKYQW